MLWSVYSDLGLVSLALSEEDARGVCDALAVYGVTAWMVVYRS